MTDEIKPCPWCKGRDIRYYASGIGTRNKCMTCHAEGPPAPQGIQGYTPAETRKLRAIAAAEMWNTRTTTPAVHEPLTQAEHLAEMQRLGQLYDAAPLTTNPELLAALEASAGYEMSEEEIRLQKESWVRGQCGPSTSTVVPAHAAPQDMPDIVWVVVDENSADESASILGDIYAAYEKGVLVGSPVAYVPQANYKAMKAMFTTNAATLKAISDARIAALQAERDEDANQLDSARHTVDVLTARIATARNEALEKAAGYHDLRVEAATEDLADCDDEPQEAAVQRVINRHKHYAKGIRAFKMPEVDG